MNSYSLRWCYRHLGTSKTFFPHFLFSLHFFTSLGQNSWRLTGSLKTPLVTWSKTFADLRLGIKTQNEGKMLLIKPANSVTWSELKWRGLRKGGVWQYSKMRKKNEKQLKKQLKIRNDTYIKVRRIKKNATILRLANDTVWIRGWRCWLPSVCFKKKSFKSNRLTHTSVFHLI